MDERRAYNAQCQRRRRATIAIREVENERKRRRRANPAIREEENARNRESHRRRRANAAIREEENAQRAVARSNGVVDMACKYINGEYLFHQPCGIWNVPCRYGCGYIHLSSSTPGTRKKGVAPMAVFLLSVKNLMKN